MAARKTVGVEAVREFARENKIKGAFTAEKARGRVPKALIERFEKETGQNVGVGFKAEKTVGVKVSKVTKSGRRTRTVQKSIAEVRSLAGESAGLRGVLSATALAAAGQALSDPLTSAEVAKSE